MTDAVPPLMNTEPHHATPQDDRLGAAIAELVQARERGDVRSFDDVLERYADLAEQLHEFLRLEDGFGLADPLSVTPERGLDRYRPLVEVGRGTYGRVYRGRDRVLGRQVAVKVFRLELSNHAAMVRFLEEPQIASQLDHPGIAAVHDLGRMPDGRPYFVMKWIGGEGSGTLADLLREKRGPGEPRLLQIFKRICETVAHAHRRGVLHRDLKPANVMIGEFGEVLILDWGLSKVVLAEEGDDQPIQTFRSRNHEMSTQAGSRIGTLAYAPPEQATGDKGAIAAHSDVFGLGAILCEILTGKPPYCVGDVKQEAGGQVGVVHLDATGFQRSRAGHRHARLVVERPAGQRQTRLAKCALVF
jgi:serine/threonine protein kinase